MVVVELVNDDIFVVFHLLHHHPMIIQVMVMIFSIWIKMMILNQMMNWMNDVQLN